MVVMRNFSGFDGAHDGCGRRSDGQKHGQPALLSNLLELLARKKFDVG